MGQLYYNVRKSDADVISAKQVDLGRYVLRSIDNPRQGVLENQNWPIMHTMKATRYREKEIRFYTLNQTSLAGNKESVLISLSARLIRQPNADLSHLNSSRKKK
jgi:hypothetical protein